MGIFSRFADIVNSNINSLLDKAEDPEKLIRLIVQEMEDTLVEVRTTSARTIAEKKELAQRIEVCSRDAQEWESKASLALNKGREDLAKAALAERNKANEVSEELRKHLAYVEQDLTRLSTEISQLQEKLNDAKARQKALLMRHKTSESRLKVKRSLHNTSSEGAFDRFDRFEQRLNELESEVESYDLGRNKNLADEISELERAEVLDAQLAELKARLNKKQ